MLRPTTKKAPDAMRLFAQQSRLSTVESELHAATSQVKELQSLLQAERAKTAKLEAENRRLRENWRAAFANGAFSPVGGSRSSKFQAARKLDRAVQSRSC
jgi:hypothetical protein